MFARTPLCAYILCHPTAPTAAATERNGVAGTGSRTVKTRSWSSFCNEFALLTDPVYNMLVLDVQVCVCVCVNVCLCVSHE